jgi:hypothetical protein
MESFPLLIMIIGLTIGLGFAAASVDAREVKADWAKRRCDPLVIAGGFMYKPDSDSRSSSEFAFDNLKFCTERFVKHTIMETLAPLFTSFAPIVGLAGGVSKVFNGLRQMLHDMYNSFLQIIGKFYQIFERYILEVSRVTQLLKSSFGKINATLTSAVYMAISIMTAGYNSFKFIVLVTQVILGVISGLAVVLFFQLAPFGALIAAVTAAITTAVNTVISITMVDGFENKLTNEGFCFTADTQILLVGGKKSISELHAGDVLADGGQVKGMLVFDGSRVDLFDYKGIHVSGEHLVLEDGKWIRVADSASARPLPIKADQLFCPVTTNHRVPISDASENTVIFADWEEMDEEQIKVWEKKVREVLHVETPYNSEIPELGGDVCVMCTSRGKVSIRDIQIGDTIDCINKKGLIGDTQVRGIYKGDATTLRSSSDIGCGVWRADAERHWYKNSACVSNPGLVAYHLITDEGTFLTLSEGRLINVRDFTEVGMDQLPALTPQVIAKLNT